MAVKTQPQEMKDAYGQRFSQQDLTDPEENQIPQPLETSTSQKGDLAFARSHQLMKEQNVNRNVPNSTVKKAKKVTR
jgi:hypothetical protein